MPQVFFKNAPFAYKALVDKFDGRITLMVFPFQTQKEVKKCSWLMCVHPRFYFQTGPGGVNPVMKKFQIHGSVDATGRDRGWSDWERTKTLHHAMEFGMQTMEKLLESKENN